MNRGGFIDRVRLTFHQRFRPEAVRLRNEAPTSTTFACAHREAAKANNEDLRKENWYKQRETKNGYLFFFLYVCVRFPPKKQSKSTPNMIARLGSSRPEMSRGSQFKSPSFIVIFFFSFFCMCFFLRCCWWYVVVPKKIRRGFDTNTHIHTTDHGLVVQGVLRSGVNN